MTLSKDAIIFGLGFLNGPNGTLAFGGEGAGSRLSDRGRSALDELLAAGYAAPETPTDQIVGREFYRGVRAEPALGALAREVGYDPFDRGQSFDAFVGIGEDAP